MQRPQAFRAAPQPASGSPSCCNARARKCAACSGGGGLQLTQVHGPTAAFAPPRCPRCRGSAASALTSRASPRVPAAYSPGAREGMIRRPPARRGGDVSRRPEPSPWLRPGLWRWAGTLCFYRGQIFARMLAVEAVPRRLLRGASTGLFGGRCCSRGGTRRACGGASDRVQSRYVMCSYVVALVMYRSGYRGPRQILVHYSALWAGRG